MASNKPPTPAVDVLIIGAGLSGLTAGKTLHEAGIRNIAILEADSRIGGRIRTAELGGYTVEMGANWLIGGGPKSSRLFEIANHLRLNNRFSDFNYISSNAYKQDGGMYSKQEVEEAFEAAEARVEFCNQLSSSDGDDISISAAQRLGKQ
ncbi:Polyamine oxidase 1 [Linum perenne]